MTGPLIAACNRALPCRVRVAQTAEVCYDATGGPTRWLAGRLFHASGASGTSGRVAGPTSVATLAAGGEVGLALPRDAKYQGRLVGGRCVPAVDAQPADEQLVLAYKRGDARAFAALFARYQLPVFNYIRRLIGNREAAEDLTQETFYKAFVNLGRTAPDTHFRAWLYRIATNVSISYLRAKRPQVSLDGDEETLDLPAHDFAGNPEVSQLRRETAELVHSILRRMHENHRQVLLLRDHQGLSYLEIAEVMGLSVEAVTSLLHRARQDFRARYAAALAAGAAGGRQ